MLLSHLSSRSYRWKNASSSACINQSRFAARPQEEELVSSENSASIFNTLSDLPSQLKDGPAVLGEATRLAGSLSQETLEAHRHKHLAYILNEQTQLNNGNNAALGTNLNKVELHPPPPARFRFPIHSWIIKKLKGRPCVVRW